MSGFVENVIQNFRTQKAFNIDEKRRGNLRSFIEDRYSASAKEAETKLKDLRRLSYHPKAEISYYAILAIENYADFGAHIPNAIGILSRIAEDKKCPDGNRAAASAAITKIFIEVLRRKRVELEEDSIQYFRLQLFTNKQIGENPGYSHLSRAGKRCNLRHP